jgi:hypothetical protein
MHTRIRVPAMALIALIAMLAAACGTPSHMVPLAAGGTSSAQRTVDEGPVPLSVPRQYVTLDSADFKRLSVRDTVTGRVTATVSAPRGMDFTGVFGAGTGRVFVIDATQDPPSTMSGDNLFLLRLGPGSAPLPLVSLHSIGSTYQPVSVRAALSPDGARIAIAYSGPFSSRKPLTVYSTATGAALRSWTMSSGLISSGDLTASGDLQQDPDGTSMHWTADGRGLAYAFHSGSGAGQGTVGYDRYASIRLLDTAKPGSDLLANSKVLVGAGVGYAPGGSAGDGAGTQCLTGNGWSLSGDGQAVTCAAQWIMPGARSPGSPAIAGAACPATGKHVYVGFWRSFWLPGGGGGADTVYGPCPAGFRVDAQLYWASPDGKLVLGTMNYPGHAMFGLFSGDRTFIPLAPPPARLDSLAW